MNEQSAPLRSGELAKLVGVSTDTLRHYERMGLIPRAARTASGYRMYSRGVVDRVAMIRHSLQLGFTLRELAEIFRIRDRGGAPCARVLAMTEEKLAALDERIRQLQDARRSMDALVREWRAQMAHTEPGQRALLLHSLNGRPTIPAAGGPQLTRRNRA